ncbi:collagen alpha-1(V) chain-like [Folsomia candida]|uniref:collagen alpha-1(V) chain-like n=1 Tax=Folsomia candida TaxID=158441 RepID=UPI00160517F4|nr:collagen alpha-1(V) chain-like [Folsomia candida]
MIFPKFGQLIFFSTFTFLILLNFNHNFVVSCATLGILDNPLLKSLNEADLTISNFEYVKKTPEDIRIGCRGDLDPSSSSKKVKSLFIQDIGGYKELQTLTLGTATYKNASGTLEERKVFLREFPDECFRLMFSPSSISICPPGPRGKKGKRGVKGLAGLPGLVGFPGKAGTPGRDGADGAIGPSGDAGLNGECGDAGEQGSAGLSGFPGNDGFPGEDGKDWTPEE